MWHLASLALKERTKERKATAGFYIFRPKLIYLLRNCENKWKKTIDLTWGILLVGHNICCGRVCHDRWLRGASPLLNVNSTNIMALWKDSLHACIFFHLLGYSVADKQTRYSRWPSTFSVPSWRFWGIPKKNDIYIYNLSSTCWGLFPMAEPEPSGCFWYEETETLLWATHQWAPLDQHDVLSSINWLKWSFPNQVALLP